MDIRHRPGISTREVIEFLNSGTNFAVLKESLETKEKSVKWLVIQRKYAIQMIGFLRNHKELFPHKRRKVGRAINYVEQYIAYLNKYLNEAREKFRGKHGILGYVVKPIKDMPERPNLVRGKDLVIGDDTYVTYKPKGM
ncbi:hypothetical protein SM033_00023 [Vibrio phage vB_VpaM_sm033]|nr:hypothetical protein SM033_00023 [Vibrio phage vB_VpaM_sm033]